MSAKPIIIKKLTIPYQEKELEHSLSKLAILDQEIVGWLNRTSQMLSVPPWPMYRRKPLAWQKPRLNVETETTVHSKSKKKK
ncbi:hypothetical protein B566_EDAN015802 [Ephemera danica]|nr:hypothetical protein B566_EDAN015802 [Ephemera danica]